MKRKKKEKMQVLLGTSIFLILGGVCHLLLIIVFPGDCARAAQKDLDETESADEKSSLTGKGRAESILDTYVRSRATTVNSYLWNICTYFIFICWNFYDKHLLKIASSIHTVPCGFRARNLSSIALISNSDGLAKNDLFVSSSVRETWEHAKWGEAFLTAIVVDNHI